MGHEILLVEDNPGDVTLFRQAIDESRTRGEVHVATTGEEALSLLEGDDGSVAEASIDLVVLDLNLPGKSGFEVLRELKRGSSTRTTPVLVLSTSDSPEDVRKAYELGANAYLVKPTGFGDAVALLDALETFWLTAAELPE